MAKFKDCKDRDWNLCITIGLIEQVQAEHAIDLETILANRMGGLRDLMQSSRKFVSVAFCLIEEQADAAGVTPEDFGRAIDGPALLRLRDAFLDAVSFFFQTSKATLQALWMKGRETEGLNDQEEAGRIQKADAAAILKSVRAQLDSSNSPTSLPEKPEA